MGVILEESLVLLITEYKNTAMKVNRPQQRMLMLMIILLTAAFLSCEKEEQFILPSKGDYYPLQEGNEWMYVRKHTYRCNCPDSGLVLTDTLELYIDRSLMVEDEGFFRINDKNHNLTRYVRKQGNQYIDMPPYRQEYIFLMEDKPANYSWTHRGEFENTEIEFTVKGVNGTMEVNGIQFRNVTEIREIVWVAMADAGTEQLFSVTHHYYASDIGEIYSMQSLYWNDDASTIGLTLLKHSQS